MPEITYPTLKPVTYKVSGIVTFTVEAEGEVRILVDPKSGPNWDFASQAKLALVEAAKKNVQMGNCEARISKADIHL